MKVLSTVALTAGAAIAQTQFDGTIAEALLADAGDSSVADGQLTSLATLLTTGDEYADIVAAFSNADASLTLFAPNNAAIDAVPDGTGLTDTLLYHGVGASLDSGDVTGVPAVNTLLTKDAGGVTNGQFALIDPAALTVAGVMLDADYLNINCTNGYIHVLQGVMMPPADVATVAFGAGLTTLAGAIVASGQGELIGSLNDLTAFAPTNDAFTAAGLDNVTDADALTAYLAHHVIAATTPLYSFLLQAGDNVAPSVLPILSPDAFPEDPLTVTVSDEGVTVTDTVGVTATVTMPNVPFMNGVAHVVDTVLQPDFPAPAPTAEPTPADDGAASAAAPMLAVAALVAFAQL